MSQAVPVRAGDRVFTARRALTKRLQDAGIENADLDARYLLSAVLVNGDRAQWLDPERCLEEKEATQLQSLCARREAREPLSQILGSWGFWTLDLTVTKDVLTPRPETERLIELALQNVNNGSAKILDLGTGSGAIILALLSERKEAHGMAVDRSAKALDIARTNAAALGLDTRVRFIEGDWDAALAHAPFDLVAANPPYIPHAEIAGLDPEVRSFEPMLALDGGADGLDAYRTLLPLMPAYLKPGGFFAFEIGGDQGLALMALAQNTESLKEISLFLDLTGRDRVLCGRRD
ncbi:MAG: protein-(glutamine-N5) methyltransferase, release factor-specific [Robiginitomaculum sp.]|nr:MAG: protein-(glutamine-N5) methyltransferase, release factor-specific [Robiginitomaculum sp.]